MGFTIDLPPLVYYTCTIAFPPIYGGACYSFQKKFQRNNITTEFASRVTYPDPFKPTGIEFDLPEDARVTLTLLDHAGSELSKLIIGQLFNAGTHIIDFASKGFAKGTYFYRLSIESGGKVFTDTKRIVI